MVDKNNRKAFDIRNRKHEAALARQVARANRTIEQQLERLKQRPGRSAREVARLMALLTAKNMPTTITLPKVDNPPTIENVEQSRPHIKAKERKAKEKKQRPGHQEKEN
jgi:citrate lyase beta subunit